MQYKYLKRRKLPHIPLNVLALLASSPCISAGTSFSTTSVLWEEREEREEEERKKGRGEGRGREGEGGEEGRGKNGRGEGGRKHAI